MNNTIIEFTAEIAHIRECAISGLLTDGWHHKQWYFEKILEHMGIDIEVLRSELNPEYDFERGVAP